jgi:acetyl esterase/lipase
MTVTHNAAEAVIYQRHGRTELALDIFRPQANTRHFAILILHGGGWRAGSKEAMHTASSTLDWT